MNILTFFKIVCLLPSSSQSPPVPTPVITRRYPERYFLLPFERADFHANQIQWRDRGKGLTLSLTSKVHCGGCGKWAVVLWTISLKEEPGLTFLRYCFHRMVPELLSIPKS